MLLNCGVGEDSWTVRRSNQSILKEISPEYSPEGLMLKLKFQYFGHLTQRTDSWKRPWCWEGLKVGGEGDSRRWDGWMASPTRWSWVWANLGSWWGTGTPGKQQSMESQRVGHDWAAELNWTDWNCLFRRSPTYEPSSCEPSKVQTCVPSTSGMSDTEACPPSLLLLAILQIYHHPPPLPPPVSNSSCLFTDASPCLPAVVLDYCTLQSTIL